MAELKDKEFFTELSNLGVLDRRRQFDEFSKRYFEEIEESIKSELNKPRQKELNTDLSSLATHKARVDQRINERKLQEELSMEQFQPPLFELNVLADYIKSEFPSKEQDDIDAAIKAYCGGKRHIPRQFQYVTSGQEYINCLKRQKPREKVTKEESEILDRIVSSKNISNAISSLKKYEEWDLSQSKKFIQAQHQLQLIFNLTIPSYYDQIHLLSVPNQLQEQEDVIIMIVCSDEERKNSILDTFYDQQQYMVVTLSEFKVMNQDRKKAEKVAKAYDFCLVERSIWNKVYKKKHSQFFLQKKKLFPFEELDDIKVSAEKTRLYITKGSEKLQIVAGFMESDVQELQENVQSLVKQMALYLPFVGDENRLNNVQNIQLKSEKTPSFLIYQSEELGKPCKEFVDVPKGKSLKKTPKKTTPKKDSKVVKSKTPKKTTPKKDSKEAKSKTPKKTTPKKDTKETKPKTPRKTPQKDKATPKSAKRKRTPSSSTRKKRKVE